jgi:hypothetical protein
MPGTNFDTRLVSMAWNVIEHTTELRHLVANLVRVRDGTGMLSITIGIEPGAVSGRTPRWEIALENDLDRLRHESRFRSILARRLEEASTRLEELLNPAATGRGRALFIALDSGVVSEAILRRELPTGARIGAAAHVLPLLGALHEGELAGLVSASRDSILVSECELQRVRHVERIDVEPWTGDWWPEMKGPARANPQRGQQIVSQRDGYARRLAAAYRHSLDDAAVAIGMLAGERGWKRAVLAGDRRRTDVLDTVLRQHGLTTAAIEGNLEGLRTEDALERLRTALATEVRREGLERAQRAAEEAAAGGKGACGLVAVLAALADGRVAELLIDTTRTFVGVVGPGEMLAAPEGAEGTVELTDLIVSRALSTGAEVVPLNGDGVPPAVRSGGIAARLRW